MSPPPAQVIFVLLKHFLALSTADPHVLQFPAPTPPSHTGQLISPFPQRSVLSGLSPASLLWAGQNSFMAALYVAHVNSCRVKEEN